MSEVDTSTLNPENRSLITSVTRSLITSVTSSLSLTVIHHVHLDGYSPDNVTLDSLAHRPVLGQFQVPEAQTDSVSAYVLDMTTMAFNSSLSEAPRFTNASLTKAVVFGVMFLVSFVGNVATLVQMRKVRRRKSTINTLIVHLAVADLLVSFFCIAGESVWAATVQWMAGNLMCKLFKYMQVFALYLSTYITVAISLDRCVAVLDPMRRNEAAQRVRIMISFAWIFSALFSIPQVRFD
ncbi:hypothetical protein Btru_043673 [Bulinus truncatus]|nr:hypothetical protein Btru_043673 [Bulinus truncatus]